MNLLEGTRAKYVLRRHALLWPCVERSLKKLEFDEEMTASLAVLYGPYRWEAKPMLDGQEEAGTGDSDEGAQEGEGTMMAEDKENVKVQVVIEEGSEEAVAASPSPMRLRQRLMKPVGPLLDMFKSLASILTFRLMNKGDPKGEDEEDKS